MALCKGFKAYSESASFPEMHSFSHTVPSLSKLKNFERLKICFFQSLKYTLKSNSHNLTNF